MLGVDIGVCSGVWSGVWSGVCSGVDVCGSIVSAKQILFNPLAASKDNSFDLKIYK